VSHVKTLEGQKSWCLTVCSYRCMYCVQWIWQCRLRYISSVQRWVLCF